ncbi:MAG: HesB/IscA family protein [Actinomycetota bacterium]
MLTVTPKAVAAIRSVLDQDARGVRVTVGSGCSGLSYQMALEDRALDGDEVLDVDGVAVFVDAASVMWLAGATMDFVDGPEGAGFVFHNPNAVSKCGSCGKTC